MEYISTEIRDKIILIGLNRPAQNNAFNIQMLMELSKAITDYEENDSLRCAVLFAHGKHFTVGLQLDEVREWILQNNKIEYPEGQIDPFKADHLLDRSIQIAKTISENAPLGIRATLENAYTYLEKGESVASQTIQERVIQLMRSEDGSEGTKSFLEKRKANFQGK